eukprot:1881664-Pyramimonas_sp.AAC.1
MGMSVQSKNMPSGSDGVFSNGITAPNVPMPTWVGSSSNPTTAIRTRVNGDPYSMALTRMALDIILLL